MIFKAEQASAIDASNTIVRMRCPSCRQKAKFEKILPHDIRIKNGNSHINLGQRKCPDPSCNSHIFFAYDSSKGGIVASYPTETIDFDTTDIPTAIVSSLEEAITCHANRCFKASAIMVRKTLEEICKDRSATGGNLKQRLEALKTVVILPPALLDGLDNLRLLGNDAAHIESQAYDKVGFEEVEIAIEITKEFLKAIYQYSSLIKKLEKFKKT